MSNTLGAIHRAMSADTDLVRLIAENIANAQTAGYQRKFGVQQVQFAALSETPNAQLSAGTMSALTVMTDSAPGTLAETGEPLDIALSGVGSLVVSGENGESYIRGGRMRLNDQGLLVTQQGQVVQGTSGAISFSGAAIDSNSVSIGSDGTITVAGTELGKLLIHTDGADQEAPRVMQGFVETSNVESVTEMLKLMEVIRHFEATQKMARSYDDLMQQAIADIGKI